jgi:DNA-binding CsgD family transcriptional regulator/PAS domain-containing protein
MDETQRLSALIGDIYDAALDPTLWLNVLEKAATFVGGPAASVYSKDVTHRSGQVFHQYGLDPDYVRLYVNKYIKLDPSTNSQIFASVGDIISTSNFIVYEEFLRTRFYKEWARPQRLVDSASAVLEKSATDVAMFTVFRHKRDGLVNDEMRRRMLLLTSHVRRAVLIGRLLDRGKSEVAEFADTFDGLSAGMFLVDADGRIIHANAAGRILLSTGALTAVGSRLGAGDSEINKLLRDVFMAASYGDYAIDVKGISLPLTAHDGENYVAHILPLTSGARRRAGATYAASAVLFAYKAALKTSSPLEAIVRRYKLTATELRVLLAIVEVGGVPEAADALGVSVTTVKSHLARLFEKTGARRQADLVKLVAAFSNPLLD